MTDRVIIVNAVAAVATHSQREVMIVVQEVVQE